MAADITLHANIDLGIVPTHTKFVGGLVPDEEGRIPRDEAGQLKVVANQAKLCAASRVKLTCVQVPYFPGLNEDDVKEMTDGLRALGLDVHFIMMVGGADPMNPADEDAVVGQLVAGLTAAIANGVKHVSSTSIEEWMQAGATPKTGDDLDAAIAQNVKVHNRACEEAGVAGSCIENWHIEFLRGGEFQTFTSARKGWEAVKAINASRGDTFFKLLVDAAHCGNSELSIPENIETITALAASDELGIFHASAPTTRGCLSTDDGWIGALLRAAAETGKLKFVFVELFHHADDALQALRDLEPGHGVDTTDGRDYDTAVLDGITDVARRINNLVARGLLK